MTDTVEPPGFHLRDLMEARGWTQTDLVAILGWPMQRVNEIVLGKRSLSAQSQIDLGAAFGTDPMYWARLDIAYQLSKVTGVDREGIRRRRAAMEARQAREASGVPSIAARIAVLAEQITQATDLATIAALSAEIRRHVARLPYRRPRKRRRAA